MRQGQQNRRGRSRNRKGQNPLTRSFESSGPDIKIRGTPSHIAEKYVSLARDALSSGDPVLAENHLQHAEHYNRIIMTYREQQSVYTETFNGVSDNRNRSREIDESVNIEESQNTNELAVNKISQTNLKHTSANGESSEEISAELSPRSERRPRRTNNTARNSTRSRRNGVRRENNNEEVSYNSDVAIANNEETSHGDFRQDAFSTMDVSPPDFLKRPVRRVHQTTSDKSKSSIVDEYDDVPDKSGD
ncbi:MAG TPA: hypothetical protein TECP_00298 [Hyphomicrobiaceae bacterium MAG_BT-2024]